MCVAAQVDLLLQCTERTFATAVADVRRLDMTRADFFFEVGTVYVAYAAPPAKLKLFWRIAFTANPCLLASIPIFATVVAHTNSSDTNVLDMSTNFLGDRTFILTETVGNLGKGLLGVEHQFDILTVL